MISVRSEVQVLPGPPAFAARAASVGEPTVEARRLSAVARLRAKADGADGAIAQLGERVLCKHEVVGSIPSGSTRIRDAEAEEAGPDAEIFLR